MPGDCMMTKGEEELRAILHLPFHPCLGFNFDFRQALMYLKAKIDNMSEFKNGALLK